MKIAHLICTYPPYKGGMGNSVEYLSQSLNKAGYSATVYTPLYSNFSNSDSSVIRLKPWFTLGNAAVLPQLFFGLRNFDIIHLHYPFYGTHLFVWLASIIWQIPLVIHYHMDTESSGFKGLVFKINRLSIEPLLLRRATAIIGSSLDYLGNSYISDFVKNHPKNIFGIPFGVRESLLEPTAGVEKTKSILFVSSLDRAHYFKGLNVLFEAFAQLKKSNAALDWKLEIVGDGDMRKEYIEACMKLGILESVDFLGKISDEELKTKYREAGFLVLPSTTRGEAFGIVLIEAMVSGTPVIASNLPGVRSVFQKNVHGLQIEPGSVTDLATALNKMISDDRFRTVAGHKSREFALANYTQKMMAGQVIEIYNNILAK